MACSSSRQFRSFKFVCTNPSIISSFTNGVKGLYKVQCQVLIGFVSSGYAELRMFYVICCEGKGTGRYDLTY